MGYRRHSAYHFFFFDNIVICKEMCKVNPKKCCKVNLEA